MGFLFFHSMRSIIPHSLFPTGCILWVYEGHLAWDLGAFTLRKCAWKADEFFLFISQRHPREGLFGLVPSLAFSLPQPILLSLTYVTQPVLSPFL